ncbi:MAG: response regulator transcription factor, partial [Propionibacteriales bacterium]|nr:response regulator transcription factor [Propionibacteriales bacterium]
MSSKHRLLVVEDDAVINQALSDRLEAEGYDVVRAWDGPGAVAAFGEHQPDLVVLDVMLPGYDGHEVCRRIQAERPVPVIMLTARAEESDVLVGLGVGADDYLTKPFRMRELVARIGALLRRVERAAELVGRRPLVLGVLRVDPAARRVWRDDDEI